MYLNLQFFGHSGLLANPRKMTQSSFLQRQPAIYNNNFLSIQSPTLKWIQKGTVTLPFFTVWYLTQYKWRIYFQFIELLPLLLCHSSNHYSTLLGPRMCIIHGLQSLMGCILPTMHCRSQYCWELLHLFDTTANMDETTPNYLGPTMLEAVQCLHLHVA